MTPQQIAKYRSDTHKPQVIVVTKQKKCSCCGKRQSIGQFFDKNRQPTHDKCKQCRIRGK